MFRKEAITATRQRLHGDVFLIQPLSLPVLVILIFSIVSLALVCLISGSYARSEQVSGHLVPSRGFVKIRAARSGTLESIDVSQGETVRTGKKLAVIRVSTNTPDGASFADLARAALERQAFELQTQLALETNQLEAETARLGAEKDAVTRRIRSLEQQLALQRQITRSMKAAFMQVKRLLAKGYMPVEASERRRQAWLQQETRENLQAQELNAARSQYRQLGIRLRQIPNESRQRVARLKARQAELEGRKNALAERNAYAITAPVAGRVLTISVNSAGRSVRAGQALLTIMPEGSVLEAELFVPSRAIGLVARGQDVRLLYDAFPYQFFGSHKATVTEITASILSPEETLAPFALREPVYRVTARLEKVMIQAGARVIALQSGMTLRANIVLERRSFLDWLLEPLRAVRERT